jgi:hypothetical protein
VAILGVGTMAMKKVVNGVKVHALFETIDAKVNGPEVAKFSFRSDNKWVIDMSFKGLFL